jgi:hypothetical protein
MMPALLLALGLTMGALGADLERDLGFGTVSVGKGTGKIEGTPGFCQEDEEAGFADGGSNYCAPTAISNGLIYLAQARGLAALAPGSAHADQINLIKELAADMGTDPKNGTDPDRITTGLRRYVEGKGLRVGRLEVATWRKLGLENRACSVGKAPELEWMRAAAADPDCVEVFNVGWYRTEPNGYSRHGGHWVTVVGAGPGPRDFSIHNPLLRPQTQKTKMGVALTLLDRAFAISDASGKVSGNMGGYYRVDGPGLPLGSKTAAAVLDSVIVFSVQK